MKDNMSVMERKFFNEYIKDGDVTNAARRAGYKCKNKDSFYQTGKAVLRKIQPTIDDIMEAGGLTDALIIKAVLEGLGAKELKMATFQGKITDTKNVPDYATRAKYIDIIARLKGINKDKHEVTGPEGTPLVPTELGEALLDMVKAITGKDGASS